MAQEVITNYNRVADKTVVKDILTQLVSNCIDPKSKELTINDKKYSMISLARQSNKDLVTFIKEITHATNAAFIDIERRQKAFALAKKIAKGEIQTIQKKYKPNAPLSLSISDGGKRYALVNSVAFGPLGISIDNFLSHSADEYRESGYSYMAPAISLSTNEGKGFYGTVGYESGKLGSYKLDRAYFVKHAIVPVGVDYTPYISVPILRYGFGYQTIINRVYLSVSYEWFQKHYQADPVSKYSFGGLDKKVTTSSFNFKIGYCLTQ